MHPDGLSYKDYNYCDKLRNKLFLFLQGLWRQGESVDVWCKAEGIYLPKGADTELISQFRPIPLLNVDGKILMGIFAKRTVIYLHSNGYIDESTQKVFVSGIVEPTMHDYQFDAVRKERFVAATCDSNQ